MKITIEDPVTGQSSECEPILRALPEWFGIEEAIREYARDIDDLPTVLARTGEGEVVGFLTLKEHSLWAAEIHVMGVKPTAHRRGIGRRLVARAEAYLRHRGFEYLQVKTLSAAHPDEHYARTRAFYRAVGFKPLQEFPALWGEANPCLQMIKWLGGSELSP